MLECVFRTARHKIPLRMWIVVEVVLLPATAQDRHHMLTHQPNPVSVSVMSLSRVSLQTNGLAQDGYVPIGVLPVTMLIGRHPLHNV